MDYNTETSRLLTKDQQVEVSDNIAKLKEYGYVFLDDWNVYCENDTIYCENRIAHYCENRMGYCSVTIIMPPGTEATVEFVKLKRTFTPDEKLFRFLQKRDKHKTDFL